MSPKTIYAKRSMKGPQSWMALLCCPLPASRFLVVVIEATSRCLFSYLKIILDMEDRTSDQMRVLGCIDWQISEKWFPWELKGKGGLVRGVGGSEECLDRWKWSTWVTGGSLEWMYRDSVYCCHQICAFKDNVVMGPRSLRCDTWLKTFYIIGDHIGFRVWTEARASERPGFGYQVYHKLAVWFLNTLHSLIKSSASSFVNSGQKKKKNKVTYLRHTELSTRHSIKWVVIIITMTVTRY